MTHTPYYIIQIVQFRSYQSKDRSKAEQFAKLFNEQVRSSIHPASTILTYQI